MTEKTRAVRWRIVIEPHEPVTRWQKFNSHKWQWTRECIYSNGRATVEKRGYADSHKTARKKSMRGLTYDYSGGGVTRAELEYALEIPDWEPTPLKEATPLRLLADRDA